MLEIIERAKAAGYAYICATYSPIRQWRDRMMEDRFSLRYEVSPSNFGAGKSDPAATLELLQREFRLMLGHLECSSVDELSTTVLEEQPHNLMFRASD